MSKKTKENDTSPPAGYQSKADVQADVDRELAMRLERHDTTVQVLAWCADQLVEAKWIACKLAMRRGRP